MNLSLGPDSPLTGSTLPRELEQFATEGVAVVIAAGNNGKEICTSSTNSFATIPNTFVVGGLTSLYQQTSFSKIIGHV
ncbi:hypothetical protein HMI56_003743 [Coelomomyces lativittatus]|nr:hypothetical protein HMI56_003743 [Coelomomyces lativittatus]